MTILFGNAADLARLNRVVAELVDEVATLRQRVVDLEGERSATERLAGEVRGLGQRLDAEVDMFGSLASRVVALDRKVEQEGEHVEAQRRKLVALAKSVDWEMDSLRKGLETLLARIVAGEQAPDAGGPASAFRSPAVS